MNTNKKIAAIGAIVLIIGGSIYFFSKKTPSTTSPVDIKEETITTEESQNKEVEGGAQVTTQSTPVVAAKPLPATNTTSSGLATYKGEFFPFEFTYPREFKQVKNPSPSTKEQETRTYSFNRLAFSGGIGGYLSFYVGEGEERKYRDLLETYPDSYSKVEVNGKTFYKRIEKNKGGENGYTIEYITFKDKIRYRFSLIVANGEREVLDLASYQVELDTMLGIAKSLKIY